MSRLPFAQVAILSPVHVFTHPQSPAFDRQMQAELTVWYKRALAQGAEAVYARVQYVPSGVDLLQALVEAGLRVIAPVRLYAPTLSPCAWHFSAADFWGNERQPRPTDGYHGVSCHSLAEVEQAAQAGFDYAFLSPIFATASHPEAVPLGLDVLAAACTRVQMPVIALGGVDRENADACRQAGAAGWAGIRSWL